MKLDSRDFETLQDGLDALVDKANEEIEEEDRNEILKRVKEAEDALIAIGTY